MRHVNLATAGGRAGFVLALAVVFVALACVNRWQRDEPVQGWWGERGPVVPHDSFPSDCSLCHHGDGWTEIRADFEFDHERETGVALEGAHAEAQCLRCHNDRGPVATFAARGCAGCHEDLHRGTMGAACEVCHDQETWRPDEIIETHARTRFPLVGAHAAAACWRCHPGGQSGNFLPVSAECETCHQADLALALDPNHVAQGWTEGCDECHVPTTWDGAGFTHSSWPLTGAHRVLDCTECHAGGMFAGTPSDCVDCHLDDYLGTTDPDHDVMGFPTDCTVCHNTNDWEDADFNHAGIVAGCADCHLDDYLATTDPDHQLEGFSTDCETCHHSFNTWEGADFDHGSISSGCADCHLDDYQATSDPNHMAAGFPTTCETCHDTNDWEDADFDHSFPITSGDHGGLDCADCHVTPGVYVNPSCIDCHEHNCPDMFDEHDDVRDFVCISSACIQCHPDGQED